MKKLYFILNFTLLILPSCSRIEMAANWADTYILNQMDKYFDVNSMQSQFIKKALKEDIETIKHDVFPGAADQFEHLQKLFESNKAITIADIDKAEDELKAVFFKAIKIFEPNAQEFVKKLDQKQLAVFKVVFNKKMRELNEEMEKPDKASDKRFNRIRSQMQSWLGNLNKAQLAAIEEFSRHNLPPLKEIIKNREKIAQQFLESFQSPDKLKSFIHTLFVNYESLRDPEYVKAVEADHKKLQGLIAEILNSMTPEQRKHVIETLKDRIDQLRKISAKKGNLGKEENVRLDGHFTSL